jgi:hypothetical protein
MKRETLPDASAASAAAVAMNKRKLIVLTPERRSAIARLGGLGKGIAYEHRRTEARRAARQAAKKS